MTFQYAFFSDLLEDSISEETFLVICACIAHLTLSFTSSSFAALESSLFFNLLNHPASFSSSVFIQDLLVTIILNVVSIPESKEEVVQTRVIPFLLGVLEKKSEKSRNKACIALSMLLKKSCDVTNNMFVVNIEEKNHSVENAYGHVKQEEEWDNIKTEIKNLSETFV